jgi:hypothetical protein
MISNIKVRGTRACDVLCIDAMKNKFYLFTKNSKKGDWM